MSLPSGKNPDLIVSPGTPMSINDLPSPNTRRWVGRKKAEVLAGIRVGLITMEEACERYRLSFEELQSWQRLMDNHGMQGLKATKLQKYRRALSKAEG